MLREELKRKSNGRKEVIARYVPQYPERAERAYIRISQEYLSIEKEIWMKYLPELKQILNEGANVLYMDSKQEKERRRKLARYSSADNTFRRLRMFFEQIQSELYAAFNLYGLKYKLQEIAELDQKLSIKEWKKVVQKTFGIHLFGDYYLGEQYQVLLEKWVSDNVALIKTVPAASLNKMKELIYENYIKGQTTSNIIEKIQNQYKMDKEHARMIARDQTAKLNAAITEHQQRDAGVSRYEWSDSRDRRVRKSHHKLNGKIFSWDHPPETEKGRHCHPGQDYQCRCCALAVFDLEQLDLPV